MTTGRRRTELLGTEFDAVTRDEMLARIDEAVTCCQPTWLTFVNVAILVETRRSAVARSVVDAADYRLSDGMGVMYGSRVLGQPLPKMISGPFMLFRLLEHAETRGYSVFLLGTTAEIIARAVEQVRARHPRLKVAGYRDGYFGSDEEASVVRQIAESGAQVLLVGMGFPRERLFVMKHKIALGVPVCMDVGGAFTVLAGIHRLAPRWIRAAGIEWLYRAAQEPRRLALRYLNTNPAFAVLLLREWCRRLFGRDSGRRADGP